MQSKTWRGGVNFLTNEIQLPAAADCILGGVPSKQSKEKDGETCGAAVQKGHTSEFVQLAYILKRKSSFGRRAEGGQGQGHACRNDAPLGFAFALWGFTQLDFRWRLAQRTRDPLRSGVHT